LQETIIASKLLYVDKDNIAFFWAQTFPPILIRSARRRRIFVFIWRQRL
jgi:hypothetical protein